MVASVELVVLLGIVLASVALVFVIVALARVVGGYRRAEIVSRPALQSAASTVTAVNDEGAALTRAEIAQVLAEMRDSRRV